MERSGMEAGDLPVGKRPRGMGDAEIRRRGEDKDAETGRHGDAERRKYKDQME